MLEVSFAVSGEAFAAIATICLLALYLVKRGFDEIRDRRRENALNGNNKTPKTY